MEDHEQHVCLVLDKLKEVKLYTKHEFSEFHETIWGGILRLHHLWRWHLHEHLFMMFNVSLDSLTSINVSLCIISQ
jgi:hypothetical protein